MFWKIILGLYSSLITGLVAWSSFRNRNELDDIINSITNISNKEILIALGVLLMMYILFNIIHSLARKINFTSPIAAGCFLVPISILALQRYKGILLHKSVFNSFIDYNFIDKLDVLIVVLLTVLILLFPLYWPAVCYLKKYKEMPFYKNSFLKNFALMCLLFSIAEPFIKIYTIFIEHTKPYMELVPFFAEIICILALYNIAFDKKILPKKFFQVSIIPSFLIVNLWTQNSSLLHTKNVLQANIEILSKQPVLFNIAILSLVILTTYMFYKYCYTEFFEKNEILEPLKTDISEKEDVKENTNLKSANKTLFIVLILLLGCLGIHWFYAKHYRKGAIYLLLTLIGCCVPSLLSIVDLIRACTKKPNENGQILV